MTKNSKIADCLRENLSGLTVSNETRSALIQGISAGKKGKIKLSVGLVCAIVLILIAFTALAVSAVQSWLDSVAQMQLDGTFRVWSIEDKVRFVEAMKSAGLDVDEAMYQTLMNMALDNETRNAAADEIVDDRYGDIMRENAKTWAEKPDTVVGLPPDPTDIFQEVYYAQHPNATEQEFTDAVAYWAREITRRYEAASGGDENLDRPEVDEAYAIACVKDRITDIFDISVEVAESAVIHVVFDEEYQVWVCSSRVTKKSIPTSSFPAFRSNDHVRDVGEAFEIRLVVDRTGDVWDNVSAQEYALQKAAMPIWNYTSRQCGEIATQGVMNFFMLTPDEIDRYFLLFADTYADENNNAMKVVLFKQHYNELRSEWKYAAIVNAGTGKMVDCFTVPMLWDRLPSLAKEYPNMTEDEKKNAMMWYDVRYNPDGNYINWTEERKKQWNALFGK